MANQTPPRNAAHKNAQNYFRKFDLQPDKLAKQSQKKERAAVEANTGRLRELRLAKEAAEKQEQDRLAAESGVTPRPKRVRAVKSVVRMTY